MSVEESYVEVEANPAPRPVARKRKSEDELFRSDIAVLLIGGITAGIVVYAIYLMVESRAAIQTLILANPAHSIGIPAAALIALFLVIFLEYTSGEPLKFKGLGMQVEGAAGPVLFWVVCFMVMILAIQLLRWVPGQ